MAGEKERFEILLEEIRDNVRAVAEGHGVIRHEMQEMEGRINERLDLNELAIKNLAKDVREIKRELGEVNQKIDRIDSRLEEHVRLPAHA